MRALLAIVGVAALLAGCSDPHAAPSVDRLDCAGCHLGEYDDAHNAHQNQNPPASTQCYQCHGTSGWYPVVGNPNRHNQDGDGGRRFSIEREAHAGFGCFDCHVDDDPDSLFNSPHAEAGFACTTCHAHRRGRTDPLHGGVGDYEYESGRCLRCHRRGEED